MRRICTTAALVGLIVLTLDLSAPSTPVVGKPLILQASGTIDPEELAFPYWFSLDAIPTSATSTCPADRWVGAQLASSTGGSIVVLSQREVPDAAGNFSIPVGVTPTAPGSLLLCGYTDDGATTTLAGASLVLNIRPAPGPAAIAGYARSGIRSCRALLSRPGDCVRRIVRTANARCRRLPSPRGRTTCLRAVRRVSGS